MRILLLSLLLMTTAPCFAHRLRHARRRQRLRRTFTLPQLCRYEHPPPAPPHRYFPLSTLNALSLAAPRRRFTPDLLPGEAAPQLPDLFGIVKDTCSGELSNEPPVTALNPVLLLWNDSHTEEDYLYSIHGNETNCKVLYWQWRGASESNRSAGLNEEHIRFLCRFTAVYCPYVLMEDAGLTPNGHSALLCQDIDVSDDPVRNPCTDPQVPQVVKDCLKACALLQQPNCSLPRPPVVLPHILLLSLLLIRMF